MRVLKYLLAGVALTALTGVATAADLPTRKGMAPAPYMQPVAAFSWTGPYIGAFAGGNWSSVSTSDTTLGVGLPAINTNGLTAGGLAGWNWGFSGFIVGAEVEAGYDHRKGSTGYTIGGAPMTIGAQGSTEGRIRGRLGWGWDRFLLFVAGGGTVTDLQINASMPLAGLGQEETRWRTGVNIGGGLDWAFSDHWVLRGEYIYDWYNSRNYDFSANNPAFSNISARQRESTARAVLSYKF